MQIVKIEEVQFSIADSASSGNTSLTESFTDLDQMVVFSTCSMDNGLDPITQGAVDADVWCSAVGTINAQRNSSPAYAIEITAYVVQFGDDTDVHKGTFSIADTASGSGNVSIGATVTLANTFGWHTQRGSAPADGGEDLPGLNACVALSMTTTNLVFTRSGTNAAITGHWFVVESSTLTVEHGTHSVSYASTSITDTITTVVLAESFLLSSYYTNWSDGGGNDLVRHADDISTTTTVRWRRAYDDTADIDWHWMVVSDSDITVERGEFTHTGASNSTAITTVDRTKTIAKSGSGRALGVKSTDFVSGTLSNRHQELWMSTNALLNTQSGAGMAAMVSPWEVITFDVQAGGTPTRRIMVIS